MVFGIILGFACTYIDRALTERGTDPPVVWTTNISSAQSLLSTVAGATISFAGTAFSVSLLVIQLASSQYSPRVVHTLFKDPFNRWIIALVVGTFSYCLVVMRSLGDNQDNGDSLSSTSPAVVPTISVALAFFLGILSVLAIVAFIDHAANTMDISQLLERITRDTIWHIQQTWKLEENFSDEKRRERKRSSSFDGVVGNEKIQSSEDNPTKPQSEKGEEAAAELSEDSHVVRFRSSGWVQEIDCAMLLDLVPENGLMKVHTVEGRYAIPGTAVCSVSPKPSQQDWKRMLGANSWDENASEHDDNEWEEDDEKRMETYDDHVLDAIMIGPSRTMRCDATYGLRQLVDVILRALSPGVNDPTTAQDGIFHVTAVVAEFLRRQVPESIRRNRYDGRLVLNEQQDYDSIVRLAFDEIRVCASSSPTVALYLLESLRLIRESLQAGGYPDRAPEIERQARLIEEGIRNNSAIIREDYNMIVRARQDRFATDTVNGNYMFA